MARLSLQGLRRRGQSRPLDFKVQLYAGGDAATPMQRSENKEETHGPTSGTFVMPRMIHTAPNGDLFVADSQAGSILVLRGVTAAGKAATDQHLRDRPRSSVWNRVLSVWPPAAMDLRGKCDDSYAFRL